MQDVAKNILIVDDEEVIRDVCFRSLDKKGYKVELAQNAINALDLLRERTFEIIFTDYKMPMMDGIELLESIKRDYPYTEVIIMTAYATIESAIYAMRKGAHDFILKPIKPDQIRVVAEKCLEKIQLGEENKALKAANEKLSELQLMKNKFIAITSHELRTPVSHLKGYIGILNDEYYEQLSEDERKQCMQVIQDAIYDLEEIVTGMHNLIHLENGDFNLKAEQIDINQLIEQIVGAYDLITKKRKQKIEFQKLDDNLPVFVDRSQIKVILSELMQNAVKFTPDGGEVEVSTKSEGDFCIISVKDNGIGIEDAEQGKIFEKFYEVQDSNYHSSSKDAFLGGGLGLGLPSVRAIVEAHGGGIKVKSEKDKGAEFLVYLPLHKKLEEN